MQRATVVEPEPITEDPPPLSRPTPLGVEFTDVTFLHWPADPAQIRPLLPPGTEPDTFDGRTYIGLVAFRMRSYGDFLETNVRIYSVDGKGRRATVFLNLTLVR